MVDLVAGKLGSVRPARPAAPDRFDRTHLRDHRQQPEAAAFGVFRFDMGGVKQRLAQQLESAADAGDGRSPRGGGADASGQPGLFEGFEVGGDAFAAGQDHDVRFSELIGGEDLPHRHVGFRLERCKIGEVRDVSESDDREVERAALLDCGPHEGEVHGILLRQSEVAEEIDHPEHRLSGGAFEVGVGVAEQRRIPPELVDQKSGDKTPFLRGECRPGAEKRGVDAAPVDVSGQNYRSFRVGGHAHVDQVARFEVDFAGTARSFKHHRIVAGTQGVVGGGHLMPQFRFSAEILPDRTVPHRFPEHDHLAADVARRLEQNRIHAHIRVEPARLRLHRLGAADLAAVRGDEGVQRHVLRLEGGDRESVLQQGAAESGRQNALSRVGGGSLDHDRGGAAFPAVYPG